MHSNLPFTITDPIYQERSHSRFEKALLKLINDERDLPFVFLIIKLILAIIPVTLFFYFPGMFQWKWALLWYVAQLVFFSGPFILMLHNTSHRMLFKKKYNFLNNIIPWFIGPFFGETPESYFAHHVAMHHPENNMEEDDSSTLPFQRDSFLHFMKYYLTFIAIGIQNLFKYLTLKNRIKIRNTFATGESIFWIITIGLCFVNWQATVALFVIPVLLYRFLMMAGNWAQHAFIDKNAPENNYRNSITCINSDYNQKCWNDGYHIGHHLKQAMHWTELPVEFQKNINKYIEEEAIVFRKIDFFVVWIFLMLKKYDWLAHFYVALEPQKVKSKDEIIALLKERTKKF